MTIGERYALVVAFLVSLFVLGLTIFTAADVRVRDKGLPSRGDISDLRTRVAELEAQAK